MQRVRELDSLRGLAALAILIYHFYATWFPCGWAAVDLFFVLSGYLITTIILTHQDEPRFLRHFYLRRGLRIWPIYYLALFALLAFGPFLPRPTRWDGLPTYLTYTQNIQHYWSGTVVEYSWYFKHTWTLALEEQFYLLWPALILVCGRKRVVPLSLTILAVSVLALASGADWWTLLGRSGGFALGGLLAAVLIDRARFARLRRAWSRGSWGLGAVALLVLIGIGVRGGLPDHGPPQWPAVTILALELLFFAVVGLVLCHAGHPALWLLRGPCLGYLGKISYGLYLYHMIVLRLRMDWLDAPGSHGRNLLHDLLTLAACFGVAALSWHLIEQPILSLKARFAYGDARDGRRAADSTTTRIDPPHLLPNAPEWSHVPNRMPVENTVGG